MKNKLNTLAIECLNVPQVPQYYDAEDLMNATLIFSHVFSDLNYQNLLKKPVTQEEKELLAEEFGKNIHQTILLATGIDMHEQIKK